MGLAGLGCELLDLALELCVFLAEGLVFLPQYFSLCRCAVQSFAQALSHKPCMCEGGGGFSKCVSVAEKREKS